MREPAFFGSVARSDEMEGESASHEAAHHDGDLEGQVEAERVQCESQGRDDQHDADADAHERAGEVEVVVHDARLLIKALPARPEEDESADPGHVVQELIPVPVEQDPNGSECEGPANALQERKG